MVVLVYKYPRTRIARTGMTRGAVVDVAVAIAEVLSSVVSTARHRSGEDAVLLIFVALPKAMSTVNVKLPTLRVPNLSVDVRTQGEVAEVRMDHAIVPVDWTHRQPLACQRGPQRQLMSRDSRVSVSFDRSY